MIFYHGTSKENWGKIQREGVLLGERGAPSRCTYLAVSKEEAEKYGPVILQVEYDPMMCPENNNYVDGCWQVRVYEPIPLSQIKELKARKEE